jgi:hypothetical protein
MLRGAPVSATRLAAGRAGEVQSSPGAANRLRLAAAPTFALMAVLTALPGSGMPDVLCAAASPLSGMVPMYVLMSVFHAPPWLKLLSRLDV